MDKTMRASIIAGLLLFTNNTFSNVVVQVETETQTSSQVQVIEQDPADEIDNALNKYISSKNQLLQQAGKAGQVMFFSGAAHISVTRENPDWAVFRSIALDEAIAKARDEYLQTLNTSFTQDTVKEFFKEGGLPEPQASDFQSQNKFSQLLDKAVALVDGAMLKQLEEMGINAAEFQQAPPEKKQTLMRQFFGIKSMTKAYGDLSGMFVVKTYEKYRNNGTGTVGVVMVLSVKRRDQLVDMIESNGSVQPDPSRARPNAPHLSTRFAAMPAPFLEKGVKLYHDAKGYPYVASFGQAGVVHTADPDERLMEREAALQFAQDDAWGALASAYNLNGEYAKESLTAKASEKERVSQLVGPGNVRTSVSSVRHKVRTSLAQSSEMRAEIKNLTGVSIEHKWRMKHTATGQEMVGVVLIWHPLKSKQIQILQSGLSADEVENKINATQAQQQSDTAHTLESEDSFDLADF